LDLDRSFGFLVNDVARLFGRRFDHNGRRLGLTRAQCRTLGYLARNEGINQAGLADLLEIRPMTLVRQIDRMEEAGWIERRPDPGDRRARRLYLTAKARPILGRIWRVANETRDEALARLAPHDAEQLIDLLRQVHATLGERLAGGVARRALAVASAAARPATARDAVGDSVREPMPVGGGGQ
jgi:MarR family transcriptional regulator, transcriptional regulator for hemolysin